MLLSLCGSSFSGCLSLSSFFLFLSLASDDKAFHYYSMSLSSDFISPFRGTLGLAFCFWTIFSSCLKVEDVVSSSLLNWLAEGPFLFSTSPLLDLAFDPDSSSSSSWSLSYPISFLSIWRAFLRFSAFFLAWITLRFLMHPWMQSTNLHALNRPKTTSQSQSIVACILSGKNCDKAKPGVWSPI